MEIISHAHAGINSCNLDNRDEDELDDVLALPDNYTPPARLNRASRRHATAEFRRVNDGTGGVRRRVAPSARARRGLQTMRTALRSALFPTLRYRIASSMRQHSHHTKRTRCAAAHGASGKSGDDGDGSDGGSSGDGEPPHQYPLLLNYVALADLLQISPGTLKNRYSRDPNSLPPAIILPGCRGPRWLLADVIRWLEDHRTTPAPVPPAKPKHRVGRPRIAAMGKGGVAC